MRYSIFSLLLFLPFCTDSTEPGPPVQSEVLLKTATSWDGTPITYPEGAPEVTALYIEIAPGEETGLHHHPVPSFNYLLEGTLEVTREGGQTVRLEAGDAVAEVTDQTHNGRNIGTGPVKLIVFYAGIAGEDITVAEE